MEQSVGMYGPPPGLQSPVNFLIMLFTYGGESGMWEQAPFFLLLISVCLLFILLRMPFAGSFKKEHIPLVFCIGWLLLGILGLSPFRYRPMRYGLFLLLPASMICGYALRELARKRWSFQIKTKWLTLVMLFSVCWYTIVQAAMVFKEPSDQFSSGKEAIWFAATVAMIVTLALSYLFKDERKIRPSLCLSLPFIIVVGAMFVLQGWKIQRGLTKPGNYLQEYNRVISQILDESAVITGPYAAALTIDNDVGGMIYMFGLSNVEEDLFDRYPITHVASDNSNWILAKKDFPFLKSSIPIVQMVVRNRVISIYRLQKGTAPPTDFELGMMAYTQRQPDSAQVHFDRFIQKYPDNPFGYISMSIALLADLKYEEASDMLQGLAKKYPNNYMVIGFCRALYKQLFRITRDPRFERLADLHEKRALELNPVIAFGK